MGQLLVVHSFSVRHVGITTPLSHKTDGCMFFSMACSLINARRLTNVRHAEAVNYQRFPPLARRAAPNQAVSCHLRPKCGGHPAPKKVHQTFLSGGFLSGGFGPLRRQECPRHLPLSVPAAVPAAGEVRSYCGQYLLRHPAPSTMAPSPVPLPTRAEDTPVPTVISHLGRRCRAWLGWSGGRLRRCRRGR